MKTSWRDFVKNSVKVMLVPFNKVFANHTLERTFWVQNLTKIGLAESFLAPSLWQESIEAVETSDNFMFLDITSNVLFDTFLSFSSFMPCNKSTFLLDCVVCVAPILCATSSTNQSLKSVEVSSQGFQCRSWGCRTWLRQVLLKFTHSRREHRREFIHALE